MPPDRGRRERALIGIRRIGIIPLTIVAFVTLAVPWTWVCNFPRFMWLEPLLSIWRVATSPGTPTLFALAYLLGLATHKGSLKGAFVTPGSGALRWWRQSLAVGVLLGTLILLPHCEPLDFLAFSLLPLVATRTWLKPTANRLWEWGLVAIGWTLVAYVLTVFKASIFLFQDPRDAIILNAESWLFGAPAHRVVANWVSSRRWAVEALNWVYFRHFAAMLTTAVFLTGAGLTRERTSLVASIFLAYLLGGLSYHILPAKGPIYYEPENYFFLDQGFLALRRNRGHVISRSWLARRRKRGGSWKVR